MTADEKLARWQAKTKVDINDVAKTKGQQKLRKELAHQYKVDVGAALKRRRDK